MDMIRGRGRIGAIEEGYPLLPSVFTFVKKDKDDNKYKKFPQHRFNLE